MKTVYSKLANLIAVLIVGMLLFAPMRFGSEDYLYAHPRSIRMNPGDSYALAYRLDADDPELCLDKEEFRRVAKIVRDGRL